MSPQKNKVGRGHITFHTSTPPTLWKSLEDKGASKNTSWPLWEDNKMVSWRAAAMRSDGVSSASAGRMKDKGRSQSHRPQMQKQLSHATLRQLQAKLEAENHEGKAIIQPLLDMERSFVQELECFLQQRDAADLRRKELIHKRWTEEVWMPTRSRVSQRCHVHTQGLRSMFMDYIQHCNTKGSVFLDSYDSEEYDPFLLSSTRTTVSEVPSPALRDPRLLQSRDQLKERREAFSCQSGGRHARCEVESQLPYHTTAAATPDGRCHRLGCWSARR